MVKFFSARMASAALSMHLVSRLPPRGDLVMDFCSTYPSCTAHTADNEQLQLGTLSQSDHSKFKLRPPQCGLMVMFLYVALRALLKFGHTTLTVQLDTLASS